MYRDECLDRDRRNWSCNKCKSLHNGSPGLARAEKAPVKRIELPTTEDQKEIVPNEASYDTVQKFSKLKYWLLCNRPRLKHSSVQRSLLSLSVVRKYYCNSKISSSMH